MKQVEKAPDVYAIDVLSKWRVETNFPIMEEAPAWLEEQQGQEEEEQQQ